MKIKFKLFSLLFLVVFVSFLLVVSGLSIDVSFTNVSNASSIGKVYLDGGGTGADNSAYGEVFECVSGGYVDTVSFNLYKVGSPLIDFKVYLTAVGSGSYGTDMVPDTGTILGTSGVLTEASLDGSGKWVNFSFSPRISVGVGVKYAVFVAIIAADLLDESNYLKAGFANDGYAGNSVAYNDFTNAWGGSGTYDASFVVYTAEGLTDPTPTPVPSPSPSPAPSAIGGESSGSFVVYFVILILFAVVAVVAGLWLTAGDDNMNKGVALLFAFIAFVIFMVLFFGSGWFG